MPTRAAATKADILPNAAHLRVSPHLPLETQLHLLQGRLTGLDDADMSPSRVRHLRSETIERLKVVRLTMAKAALATLEAPPGGAEVRDHIQQGIAAHDDKPDVFDHREYSLREQSR